jgi:hypothetical protein
MQVRFYDVDPDKHDANVVGPEKGFWIQFNESRNIVYVDRSRGVHAATRDDVSRLLEIPQPECCGNDVVMQAWLAWMEDERKVDDARQE